MTQGNPYNILRKLSPRTVIGNSTRIRELASDEGTVLYNLAGVANGVKRGAKTMPDGSVSEYVGLLGEFIAKVEGVARFFSTVCYIPGAVTDIIANRIEGGTARIEFSVRVIVYTDDSTPVGYRYEIAVTSELNPSDELLLLTEGI